METITEKTIIKLNLKPVKDLIKSYEEQQRFYKRQRKDAKLIFDKGNPYWDTMHPSIAQSKAYWNGLELRIFYAAYGLLRGKKLSQVEQNYTRDITYFEKHGHTHFFDSHMGKIEKTLEGFKSMSKTKESVEN